MGKSNNIEIVMLIVIILILGGVFFIKKSYDNTKETIQNQISDNTIIPGEN